MRTSRWFQILLMPIAAALLLLFVIRHREIAGGVQPLSVEPTGYVEVVNRGLGGKLKLEPPTEPEERATVVGESGEGDGGVEAGGEAQESSLIMGLYEVHLDEHALSDAERNFVARSYLLDDMEDPLRFHRRGDGTAYLRPGFRRRPLPFADGGRWHGRVLFRQGEAVPVLQTRKGREFRLYLDPGGLPENSASADFGEPASEDDAVRTAPWFRWTAGGEPAFDVSTVPGHDGATTVVLNRPENAVGTLLVNGEVPDSEGLKRSVVAGDWLVYRYDGLAGDEEDDIREVFYVEQGYRGLISDFPRTDQGPSRVVLPCHGLEPFAGELAASLDRVVTYLAQADAYNAGSAGGSPVRDDLEALRDDLDLQLSIDAAVQKAAQEMLGAEVHGAMPDPGWNVVVGRPIPGDLDRVVRCPRLPPRAAVAVVRIGTGELLAAASYPTETQLDEHLQRLRVHANDAYPGPLVDYVQGLATRRRSAMLTNHTLDDHQIGSTLKPLFAAAVALQWREGQGTTDPLDLRVDCHGGVPRGRAGAAVLPGTEISLGAYQDVPHGDGVDFRSFIGRSCNSFMFQLGGRALTQSHGFDVEDCEEKQLNEVLGRDDARAPTLVDQVDALAPLGRFAWLTGAVLRYPEASGPSRWNQTWWAPLDGRIRSAVEGELGCDWEVASSLASVSPTRVNLDVDSLRSCESHFNGFLKGGATNRWNNADLAVAYARLISGRPVSGHLLRQERVETDVRTGDCETFLGCDDPERFEEVRGEVLAGMALALEPPSGTAKRIRAQLLPLLEQLEEATGRPWGAYAKTGSSRRDIVMVADVDEQLEPTDQVVVDQPVANFTLALVECAEPVAGARADDGLGCAVLPPAGAPVDGFVVHIWVDTEGKQFTGGVRAGAMLGRSSGLRLLGRLADFAEAER